MVFLKIFACRAAKYATPKEVVSKSLRQEPIFNADTAYNFIQKQVDFGPRVPNSLAHQNCHEFLKKTLRRFGADVITQKAQVKSGSCSPVEYIVSPCKTN